MSSPRQLGKKSSDRTTTPPRISSPRRLLILTPAPQSHSIIPPFLHSLTGAAVTHAPQATNVAQLDGKADPATSAGVSSTFAGYTTHSPLQIATKYYTADIPIWVDELPLPPISTSSLPQSQSTTEESIPPLTEPQLPLHNGSLTWKSEFLSDEAREVRDVIGAIIVCIERPAMIQPVPLPNGGPDISQAMENRNMCVRYLKELLSAVAEVRNQIEEERGGAGEVPGLVVLVGKLEGGKKGEGKGKSGAEGLDSLGSGDYGDAQEQIMVFSTRWWEEQMSEMGHFELEVVTWDPKEEETKEKRNVFGELEGMARIREVLHTNEWTSSNHGDLSANFLLESDEESGFDKEVSELEREMFGLRLAIEKGCDYNGDNEGEGGIRNDSDVDELHVENMDGLMLRMQAIKDMAAELPEAERKAFAVKAINDIMKDM
ncbi:uncharacterized protein PADG_01998 [Paracoccidioides brasiliensis Pb18]|uniref:Uncharacterized protein n=1 Tax=Paracoccidioides brasiliensis (strain Pb18) TaxID=502780 RepID=C1G4Y2_PARBD|nr:uncharacterized protein PADG_01998 [Paracoccidioides brasiliensis Pb18]EEH45848.1 hypothetical protein PADG_01998 [Paracoccidioides brasiliensis Pb18]